MLADVEALDLLFRGHAHTHGDLDDQPDGKRQREDERAHRGQSRELVHSSVKPPPKNRPLPVVPRCELVLREQADRQRAEDAAHAVHRERAHRVVELELVEQQHAEDHQRAGDRADDERAARC